jgi:hypothetical protein
LPGYCGYEGGTYGGSISVRRKSSSPQADAWKVVQKLCRENLADAALETVSGFACINQ